MSNQYFGNGLLNARANGALAKISKQHMLDHLTCGFVSSHLSINAKHVTSKEIHTNITKTNMNRNNKDIPLGVLAFLSRAFWPCWARQLRHRKGVAAQAPSQVGDEQTFCASIVPSSPDDQDT